jgi:hypothetical protein
VLLSEYSASFDTKFFLREELILGDETILPNAVEQKRKCRTQQIRRICRSRRNKIAGLGEINKIAGQQN